VLSTTADVGEEEKTKPRVNNGAAPLAANKAEGLGLIISGPSQTVVESNISSFPSLSSWKLTTTLTSQGGYDGKRILQAGRWGQLKLGSCMLVSETTGHLEFPKGKINYLAHFMECIWSCAVC
jgi:hypothetical protein